jgi:IS1 family transposase
MANHLPVEKKAKIIQLLCEGNSMRATSRIVDVSINTVTKLLEDVGYACQMFHNEKVVKLKTERVQADEIWAFCYAKQKNVPDGMKNAGDVWTWTAIDADSKLIISWLVGDRGFDAALVFMHDLQRRLANRIQLSTDGLAVYKNAVNIAFGNTNIDFAQIHKIYGEQTEGTPTERKYSPAECTGIDIKVVSGDPDPMKISTSYVERQNLTMRMHMRRFTRLTNGFSKKIENHCYSVAMHFVYYNFVKIHKTLRVTPAMEAGLITKMMEFEDMVKLTDLYQRNSN